ncbi:hypothetical protein DXU77_14720 [Pseudomonas lactis]|nr:hypothetical protein [Pseudomonas lactis]
MWERACSRMQCVSQYKYRLNWRIREQARSHMGSAPHSGYLSAFAHRRLALFSLSPHQPKGG